MSEYSSRLSSSTLVEAKLPDADLIAQVRAGSESAYSVLWERHYPAAVSAARAVTSSHDPEDLAQEAFTRIYQSLHNGSGPSEAFRPYLYTTIRNVSISWSGKAAPTVDIASQEHELITHEDIASLTEDRAFTARAFKSLPPDWRTVLWYTEVEGMTPAEVSPLLGISPRAVSALAFRAREGLRSSWLQAHISSGSVAGRATGGAPDGERPSEECEWVEENLAAYTRDSLSARRTQRVHAHLDDCSRCSVLFFELAQVESSLRGILLPLLLGAAPASVAALKGAGLVGAGTAGSVAAASGGLASFPGRVRQWVSANSSTAIVAGAAGVLALAIAASAAAGLFSERPHSQPFAGSFGVDAQSASATASSSPTAEISDDPAASQQTSPTVEVSSVPAQESDGTAKPSDSSASLQVAPSRTPQPVRNKPVNADPIQTPVVKPTPEPTAPTTMPVVMPTTEPTAKPTAEPTVVPTPQPTVDPTPAPSTDPSVEPTAEPTPSEPDPTPDPQPSLDPQPTTDPTPEPDPTPDPEPVPLEFEFPIASLVECRQTGNVWNLVPQWYEITSTVPLTAGIRDISLCIYYEFPEELAQDASSTIDHFEFEVNGTTFTDTVRYSERVKGGYVVWNTSTSALSSVNTLRLSAVQTAAAGGKTTQWSAPFTFSFVNEDG